MKIQFSKKQLESVIASTGATGRTANKIRLGGVGLTSTDGHRLTRVHAECSGDPMLLSIEEAKRVCKLGKQFKINEAALEVDGRPCGEIELAPFSEDDFCDPERLFPTEEPRTRVLVNARYLRDACSAIQATAEFSDCWLEIEIFDDGTARPLKITGGAPSVGNHRAAGLQPQTAAVDVLMMPMRR